MIINTSSFRATSRIDYAGNARASHFPTRPARTERPAITPGIYGVTPLRAPVTLPAPASLLTPLARRLRAA